MQILVVVVQILLVCHNIGANTNNKSVDSDLKCKELKKIFAWFFPYMLSKPPKFDKVRFFLGIHNDLNGVEISKNNMSAIEKGYFDPSLHTYIIVHGYRSDHLKDWITELKDKLLEIRNINIIIIDWRKGSKSLNYINAVRYTFKVSKHIYRLLQAMQAKIRPQYNTTVILWNNLYFIGHSLGAQIGGQAARLLRNDTFFNVERITGLDPAEPCFEKVRKDLKIDRSDAKFVDIVHTQADNGKGGLGIKESIGHADFYFNGGILQPTCKKSIFTPKIQAMVCSHSKAHTYFIESIVASDPTSCKFNGYKWDGTYDQALQILDVVKTGTHCQQCAEMGINAKKVSENGVFLVLTTRDQPQCQWKKKDVKKVVNVLKELKKKSILI